MPLKDSIYLDAAATTPVDEDVLDEMMPFLGPAFGNPSSVHSPGRQARHAVEQARNRVADVLECNPAEIIFTGSGTEANNLALTAATAEGAEKRLITGLTEHEAVLRPAEYLKGSGIEVTFVEPVSGGGADIISIAEALAGRPALVSIMTVNNVTGALNNISRIAEITRDAGGQLHTDAIQAAGLYDLATLTRDVDLMSLSAHKIRGPKGVGLLFSRNGVEIQPEIRGGKQERNRRSGTENVAGIVGFARALELARQNQQKMAPHVRRLRDILESELMRRVSGPIQVITPSGEATSAPHILSMIFSDNEGIGLDGEMMVLGMDLAGVYVSTGSACSSGAIEPSHVFDSLGFASEIARGAIRFSLGTDFTENNALTAAERISEVVNRVRGNHN
jgi:cysteine desulfurase